MLKEIAIFIGIFIISIAIYLFYSPSKSGLVSFPTNIGFGFVVGLIGFFITIALFVFPKKKKEEEISPVDEANDLFSYAENLYSEVRLRLHELTDPKKFKHYDEASKEIKLVEEYIKQAAKMISIGKLYDARIPLSQAENTIDIEKNPYAAGLKRKLAIFRTKIIDMYNIEKIREREKRA